MLTRDEKKVIAYYLALEDSTGRYWSDFAPYLFPPITFAIYGLWKSDQTAIAFAFVVLLFLVLWYLAYQFRMSRHLLSAVRKYEAAVQALSKPDAEPS